MVLKFISFGAIALLLVMRLAGTRLGSRLLGVSQRVLEMVLLGALLLAGVLAVLYEQWILLVVVVVLLVATVIDAWRRRTAGPLTARGRAPRSPRSRR